MLYRKGFAGAHQQRYIEHTPEMESYFETCRTGFAEDPGTCDDDDDALADPINPNVTERTGCSTLTGSSGLSWLLLAGLAVLGRRRRS